MSSTACLDMLRLLLMSNKDQSFFSFPLPKLILLWSAIHTRYSVTWTELLTKILEHPLLFTFCFPLVFTSVHTHPSFS